MPACDHKQRSFRRPARGAVAFTLIELLVVVSLIVLLVALLMPALGKARAMGKNVVCKSNLSQIGSAFAGYRAEYQNYMPQGAEQQWYFGSGTFYDARLTNNGFCSAGVFFCPAMDVDSPPHGAYDQNRGYGYSNAFCYNRGAWEGGLYTSYPVAASRVAQPQMTIVMGDRNLALWVGTWAGGDLWYNPGENYDNPSSYESNGWTMKRHGQWLNYLFLDAHADGYHVADTHFGQNLWDFN